MKIEQYSQDARDLGTLSIDTYKNAADAAGLVIVGFELKGTPRYTYTVSGASATAYDAKAEESTAFGDADTDTWTMDENLDLKNTINTCG